VTSSPKRARAGELADLIEEELRRLGAWTDEAPPPDLIERGGAFGHEAFAFVRWIQWVLVERLREVARGDLELPGGSSIGTFAIREFDGQPESDPLRELLDQVDHLAND
jgi:uncharacterized protein YqcC (DUF446 family)